MKSKLKTIKINKFSFIIVFCITYMLLLLIFLDFIGTPLINLQLSLIKTIFKSYFNYQGFEFIAHCSGIISVITYLSIIIALAIHKINVKLKDVILSIIVLLIYNILRLILILFISNYSMFFSEIAHFVSWFVLFIIILLLIRKQFNNICF